MSFYSKHILPKFLDFSMKNKDMQNLRPSVVEQASGTVLEIGFGSGPNIPYYKNVTKLYALEPSKELYNLGKENISQAKFPIEYLNASAEKIPLVDNSVDSVVSTWTLCSIPHPEIALQEIRRVLKPNGKFIFIEHGKSPENLAFKIQKFLTPIYKRIAGGCHLDRDIDKLIQDTGFTIENLEKFQLKSKPLAFMYKGVGMK